MTPLLRSKQWGVARLESLGILLSTRSGRQKYYRANPNSSLFDELKSLAAKTPGAVDILRRALEDHREEIQAASVFSSFARQEQTADSDVDVMIMKTLRWIPGSLLGGGKRRFAAGESGS